MTKNIKNESSLKDHKLNKKELNPPFLANGLNLTTASWFDERLPEMLWAVLIVGNFERNKAIDFFRYVGKYVESNHDCYDITMTGISKIEESKRKEFISHIIKYSDEIKNILRAMLIFAELPSITIWKELLPEPVLNEDLPKLGDGVAKTFWHQSQEATDCRWVKILCAILGDKIKFSQKMENTLKGILEYPNYGDMRDIRPLIRSAEIGIQFDRENGKSIWSKSFWQYCFEHTGCMPEETVNKKIENRKKELADEIENSRKYYFDETVEVRNKLIDQFIQTSKTSTIDSRHEGAFGLALYSLTLFIEIIFYRTALSITGRLGLRALAETYITFTYLLQKEKEEPKVWDDYRSYGTGQVKLIYLKLQEMRQTISSCNLDEMDRLANEDKWVEFTSINLGHWDSANLRKMSEDAGLKDVYDKFYTYTSGFMHGNWGAVRESIYQKCLNPLHRYHRVPIYDLPLMPSVTKDAQEIINNILGCLSVAYPVFDHRIKDTDHTPHISIADSK